MRILSVAFPFAPVGPDAVGGSEQLLSQIERNLVALGHQSVVLACTGSSVSGELIEIPALYPLIDDEARRRAWAAMRIRIDEAASKADFDLIHMHGFDFHHYAPRSARSLVTLHLPLDWYAPEAWRIENARLRYNCVSPSQQRGLCDNRWIEPIENGVSPPETAYARRSAFALMLCRIYPEKGVELAIAAARAAGTPLVIAGQVFPYAEHQAYFETRIRPHLSGAIRFIGPVGRAQKAALFSHATCVLIPSLVEETSSLVAMEALAHGVPVIAFAKGALPEIVTDGITGFIVRDEYEMAEAVGRLAEIDPHACRTTARLRFSVERMVASYLRAYERIVALQ